MRRVCCEECVMWCYRVRYNIVYEVRNAGCHT